MKKISILVLIVLFTGLLTSTVMAEDVSKLRVVFLGAWPQDDTPIVQEKVNDYIGDKIGAEIEIIGIDWSTFWNKVPLMLQTGEDVDLLYTASWAMYYDQVSSNFFRPLDDLVEEYARETKEQMNPALLQGPVVDGYLYALPVEKEIAENSGIVFRKDMVEGANFDISSVKELDDLEPLLEYIEENTDMVSVWNSETIIPYSWTDKRYIKVVSGVEWVTMFDTVEEKFIPIYEIPFWLDKVALLRDWYEKGYINEEAATTQVRPNDAVEAGLCAATGVNAKPGSAEEFSSSYGVDMVNIVLTDPIITSTSVTGSMYAIPRASKHPEKAMQFLNLMHTDKYLVNLLTYGIEGKHYLKTEQPNVIKLPDGVESRSQLAWSHGMDWAMGNQFLQYAFEGIDPHKWDKIREWNKTAKPSPLLGFNFDNSKVAAEYTACFASKDQYITLIQSGAFEDYEGLIDEWKADMEANGIDKILAEMQRQYDEWKASQ